MKNDVIERLKQLEEKLQSGAELQGDDVVFLFGLSLLKDKESGN